MLERLCELPAGIIGVRAEGQIRSEDYVQCFQPIVSNARREGLELRLLYELGEDLDVSAEASAWEDMRIGLESTGCFEACAIVSDSPWVHEATRSVAMPCSVRAFRKNARGAAIAWLQALPVCPRSH